MTNRVFGMVTTNASWMYTIHALSSFAVTTPMEEGDQFILIDNDGAASASKMFDNAPIKNFSVHKNESKKSFAENANFILSKAMETSSDFIFMNNDIVFTPGWLQPLLLNTSNIVVPCCNQHIQYNTEQLNTKHSMELEEFLGKESVLSGIVDYHKRTVKEKRTEAKEFYSQYLTIPFYCVRIPESVYSKVGMFDTQFGVGGAEDTDYCLRSYLAGCGVYLALEPYLLHFQGKSTWRGPETAFETATRNSDYTVAFSDKWGVSLTKLLLKGDSQVVFQDKTMLEMFESRKLTELINAMLSFDGFELPEIKL